MTAYPPEERRQYDALRKERRRTDPHLKFLYRTVNAVGNNAKRAEQYEVLSTLTLAEWRGVLKASGGVCHYCGQHVGLLRLEIDHVIPMKLGGENTLENIVACCETCNSRKSSQVESSVPLLLESLDIQGHAYNVRRGRAKLRIYRSELRALRDSLSALL